MVFKTRLTNFIFYRNLSSRHKYKLSISKVTWVLCLLLIGFLVGNLFGTFLNTIRKYIMWDGFIILFLITFIEILNYNIYHNKNRPFLFFIQPKIIRERNCPSRSIEMQSFVSFSYKTLFYNKRFFLILLNFFKIGLMIGFFVDAFKVGS
ncbi:MAG: DUF565 domain-containing protein [Sphingobacteriaceae bacterium]|nr:MAG: DUF565 domain-containing protein [Sphingobacteriaceae bacterium]